MFNTNIEPQINLYGDAETLRQLKNLVPGLREKVPCPLCAIESPQSLYSLIPHLNDYHKMTRQAIALWLRSLPIDLTVKVPEGVYGCSQQSQSSQSQSSN